MTKRRTVKLPQKSVWNERAYRDQMNGILRDENGKMTHIHGKPVINKEKLDLTEKVACDPTNDVY